MADQGSGPGPVVGADDIRMGFVGRAGDQHDRGAHRQQGQLLRADNALGNEQPVDLRGDLLHPPESGRLIIAAQQGNQQRPLDLAQRELDAPQDFFDEQQALLLDVGVGTPAFDRDEPDHFLAVPGHALGRAVGYVAERLYHLEHALPGRRADPIVPVNYPRDRSGGDSGLTRHIVESGGPRTAESGRPVASRGRPP